MFKKPAILKQHNFSRLYFAGFSSELGSFVTDTAIMLLVFVLSAGDKRFLGTSRAIFLFCITMGSLLGGPLGVRFNKRNLLIASEILRVPVVISLFFFHNIYFIMIANGLIGFFTGIYNPCRQAVINEIVPEHNIKMANSLFGGTMAVLHLAGPLLGATLYSYFQGVKQVLTFDLFTYALGIYLLFQIKYNFIEKEKKLAHSFSKNIQSDFIDGYRYVISRLDLSAMLLCTIVIGFCIGVLIPLFLPFVKEILGKGEQAYGINISLFGLGGIFGGYFSSHLGRRFKASKLFIVGVISEAILMALWIRTTNFYLNCFVGFVWGSLVFIRIPSQLNYISETVPKEFMSRVHSFLDLAFVTPNISAGIILALIGNKLSTFEILNLVSILFILLLSASFFTKGMRTLLKA
jgi:MFS family permease